MTESRVIRLYGQSTSALCDWLANDHPTLTPLERLDLALVIEDLAAQTRKEPASKLFNERFGGRARRGRAPIASDAELLLVRDILRWVSQQGRVTREGREYLLKAHAKRLGYKSRKELEQAIARAEDREA